MIQFIKSTVMIFILFVCKIAMAHKIGNDKWCLMYTSTHWECIFKNGELCEGALGSVRKFLQKNPSKPLFSEPNSSTNLNNKIKLDPDCSVNPDPNSTF